jgi:hypothetical protein
LPERRNAHLPFLVVSSEGIDDTDPSYALAPLRTRRERPRCRAA